jgi:hypothetical protein
MTLPPLEVLHKSSFNVNRVYISQTGANGGAMSHHDIGCVGTADFSLTNPLT